MAGVLQYRVSPSYQTRNLQGSLELGAGFLTGSVTNAMYWGEDLLPTYNPHLGNHALPYGIVFPTIVSADRASAFRLSVLQGSIGSANDAWKIRAGYFDLTQSARFIFIQPTLTSVPPSIGVAPAESLGDGAPALDSWPSPEPGLPLLGADIIAKKGLATFEASNAALPSLAGTSTRITLGSAILDHGEGTRYTFEALHLWTGGAPISTTAMFGADAMTVPGPQGALPISTLGGQRATVAGVSAAFHAAKNLDGTVEVGRQWYDADSTIQPGTQRPGGYYHAAVSRRFRRSKATVEFYRFEPRYGTAILPYGVPENVWSAAWSWPGQWLKSNYEINDNTAAGVNRQGYRVKYFAGGDAFQWRVQFADYHQVEQATLSNVEQTGFVDGFFLPQTNGFGTLGRQQQYATWFSWHPKFGTFTLDYLVDAEHRPALNSHLEDVVSYSAPQLALTYSRKLSEAAIISAGYAHFEMKGMWATTPLDYGQATLFAGTEIAFTKKAGVLVELRHNSFNGLPSFLGGPSPDFGANTIVVEQRIHF